MIYLDLEDLLRIAGRVVEGDVQVRDAGLLESAAHRPRTTVFGTDAYPTLHEKAAALLHSVVCNHALVDGNKRLGLAALIAFLGLNGWRLTFTNDEAYELVMAIASGERVEVRAISEELVAGSEPVGDR